ncbi:MAG: hypothetical protein ABJA67_10045 [Chthonomonadales bacterium]
MGIENALTQIISDVNELIKNESKYLKALKALKRACELGDVSQIVKQKNASVEAIRSLPAETETASNSWQFDTRSYLESDEWKVELAEELDKLGVRYLNGVGNNILVPPNSVSASPSSQRLIINKKPWSKLRPTEVANHLKSLASVSSSDRSLQVFLNSLYWASKISSQSDNWVQMSDLYNHFCDAPGWEADNPRQSFAQQAYNLNKAGHLLTKDNKKIYFEGPTGKAKNSDVFSVVADDGRSIVYFAVYFK